ncbi:hypothetical protein BAMA_14250 [Bacillus manliponensis]|uniref:YppF-like protein n=1 Tax=Bacillus manliponensis TaxID=574376 RepID=A0A073K291_9BACI|nr:YppF family protein [Bacillus manliponensis]KEK20572.1 hypothetical protein BAMA_14250 [Bacillus manliponensis]
MMLRELKQAFLMKKGYVPESMDELLDFARHHYLSGKICLSDYRTLIRELEISGAKIPEENIVTEA